MFEAIADAVPGAIAQTQGDRELTYAQMDERASRLAAAFTDAGLTTQSRVGIDLYNSLEWLETYYGTLKDRYVPVSINYRYLDDELRFLLEGSGCEALVFHASLAGRIVPAARSMPTMKLLVQVDDLAATTGEAAPIPDGVVSYDEIVTGHRRAERIDRSGDDIVMWYTGGTTGMPKGILLPIGRSAMMYASPEMRLRTLGRFTDPVASINPDVVAGAVEANADGSRPVALPAAPLMHSTAVSYAGPAIFTCGGMVTTLEGRKLDAHELFDAVDRRRVSTVTIVGDAFAMPMAAALEERAAEGRPYDGSSIKTIYSAGVVWSSEVKQRLFEHLPGVMLVDNCGSSEGAWYGSSITRKGDPTSSSSFVPAPGVLVLDETGTPMPAGTGEPGLLASVTSTRGYHDDDEKTAENFRFIDGVWYTTPGDLGILNADGTLTLVGRGSNMINTGGEKVFPEEVDNCVKAMPEVDDCLVIGMPDDQYGQIVSAVIQLRPGAELTPEQVTEWVRDRLARYKAPRRSFFVDQVPRLPNGKPDYPTAREIAAEAFASS